MGNQARIAEKSTALSTSTRNFPNRLGKGADVFLASAELSAVTAILGRIPSNAEYQEYAKKLDATASDTYRYLNFDELPDYVKASDTVEMDEAAYEGLGPAMREELKKMKAKA
jgi:aconitate hydratase 2/2-methylisocitrate dehydratase